MNSIYLFSNLNWALHSWSKLIMAVMYLSKILDCTCGRQKKRLACGFSILVRSFPGFVIKVIPAWNKVGSIAYSVFWNSLRWNSSDPWIFVKIHQKDILTSFLYRSSFNFLLQISGYYRTILFLIIITTFEVSFDVFCFF
jgi:hypothetical protein